VVEGSGFEKEAGDGRSHCDPRKRLDRETEIRPDLPERGSDAYSMRIVAILEAAITRITRAMLSAPDEAILELVAERRAMRSELESLQRAEAGNVVSFRRNRDGT
jgi:hypothetical protein